MYAHKEDGSSPVQLAFNESFVCLYVKAGPYTTIAEVAQRIKRSAQQGTTRVKTQALARLQKSKETSAGGIPTLESTVKNWKTAIKFHYYPFKYKFGGTEVLVNGDEQATVVGYPISFAAGFEQFTKKDFAKIVSQLLRATNPKSTLIEIVPFGDKSGILLYGYAK